ncbi:multidrug ABC transporter permease [Sphaerisporangium krabiense]|uniref:ATP-binding cassette subfamily B protein n=1 Tax=Sphaerisporangium krabiense TaxID=763782 RepID=A0A7W9DS46_9ACTN|nr:ABC transporter ATP-binding protein [Sphaerisporangium krabiense]MBB5628045.1 ATP-binding cassette subfamily B protein [Sphaerisporangium krabiense]GII62210.1 multidrug ABC transporter permease [Sphaerisporangium krabiense]
MSGPVAERSEERTRTGTFARRVGIAGLLAVRAAPGTLALYVIVTLAGGASPVFAAWLTKLLIDHLAAGAGPGTLLPLATGLGVVGMLTVLALQMTQYLRTELDRRVGLYAQDRLFVAVEGFVGLRRFEDPGFLDRLRLAQQVGGITPNQLIGGVLGVGRAAMTVSGFLGSLAVLSPIMAAVALGSGVPVMLAEIALSRRRARMFWEIGHAERREFFYSELLSTVEAAKEVRLFGLNAFLRDRMLRERRAANSAKRVVDRREVLVQAGLGLLAAVVLAGGVIWAVAVARRNGFSIGDVTMFVAAVAAVQSGLGSLASEVANSHHALLMFAHYLAVTTAGPDLPRASVPNPLPPMRRGIELRDVWFRYSPEHPWVLRGVDLFIPCGRSLALVGLNGAGKSTLVKLLCRFYDPTRGSILWDGVDIRTVDISHLRRRIGAVFQDYMRYDMTAMENIALGDLDALEDRERIEGAARRAGIHGALTRLPRGYDTLLSRMFFTKSDTDHPETGVLLSGGQWQRLALARAFLRDRRDLMILDEPSAGLDAEAEAEMHSSLRQCRAGRTSLLISHRLGTIRDADLIVVLSGGRVLEQGDHEALTTAGGEYARLFKLQASGYVSETLGVPVPMEPAE